MAQDDSVSLRERVKANGGRVFPKGPSVTLLVDIKDDGRATYARLREVLQDYRDMLTAFTNDATTEGAEDTESHTGIRPPLSQPHPPYQPIPP